MSKTTFCGVASLFLIATFSVPWAAAQESQRVSPADSRLDAVRVAPNDWPWWRGPQRSGIAPAEQDPPLRWGKDQNVAWTSPIPGRGHGTPAVVGERIYLATADIKEQTQSVLCYDRGTGKRLWKTDIHRGKLFSGGNDKASQASCSVACDGERLLVNFINDGAAHASALDLDGKLLWQTKITDYILHQGYGSSPTIYDHLVLISADNKGGGAIAGLDRASGEIVWKQERPKFPNYASPMVLRAADRDQLVMIGCDLVSSFDPLTGEKLWEIPGSTTECVTSTVTDGQLVFTSGGYPKNHMSAVRADGSGKLVWENNVRVYVPSLLIQDGYLFGVTDAGVATCWQSATGEEKWKGRLGGTFSASPVLVGKRIYATNEAGTTFVFKASREKFELLAESQLGDEVFASPVICGGRIYLRVALREGDRRQEMLYCIAAPQEAGGE
jgi:outer membrane protein assembly factor BamB